MIELLFYNQSAQGVGNISLGESEISELANTGYVSAPVGYLNISRGSQPWFYRVKTGRKSQLAQDHLLMRSATKAE
jgi:hypothetical protein